MSLLFLVGCSGASLSGVDPTLITLIPSTVSTLVPYHLTVSPAAISNSNTPSISGYGTAGDTVKLYRASACAGSIIATSTINNSGTFTLASTTLPSDGSYAFSVKAFHPDGTSDCSSTTAAYVLDTTGPIISSFPTSTTVTVIPTSFQLGLADTYSSIQALSTDDSRGELTASGCSGGGVSPQPSFSIDNTHLPLITVHLSGGNCLDGDTLVVTLNAQKIKDSLGNPGLVANSVSVSYFLSLSSPSITLVRDDGLTTPITQSSSILIDLSFNHASSGSTTLVTDHTNALHQVTLSGGGSTGCAVDVTMNAGVSGGTIHLSSCSGNGPVVLSLANSMVKNAALQAGGGTSTLSLTADNAGPVITQNLSLQNAVIATLDGSNTATVTFQDASGVQTLSSNDSGAEFTVSGTCSVPPTIQTSSVDGLNYLITLSGGTCADGDTVTLALNPNTILDTVGNADQTDLTNAQTVSYVVDLPSTLLVDAGGDNGNPTTPDTLNGANNLVVYFSKVMAGGNASLQCETISGSGSYYPVALSAPTFASDGTVTWSVSAIESLNGSSGLLTQSADCILDLGQLQDALGMTVNGGGASVTSSFTVSGY